MWWLGRVPSAPVCPRSRLPMGSGVEWTEDGVMSKGPTYVGGFAGSLVGSFIPSLWGAGQLSMSSIAFFMIGGFVGIWVAYRLFG